MPFPEGVYGLLAEFDSATSLTAAAAAAYKDGWRRLDCYTPYPCEEAAGAIGFHRNYTPLGLPAQHRWTPALLLAGLRRSRLRVDDPVCGSDGSLRHARNVRPAGPVSSAGPRAELPYWRDLRQVLPVPGGAGSQVFADRVTGVP